MAVGLHLLMVARLAARGRRTPAIVFGKRYADATRPRRLIPTCSEHAGAHPARYAPVLAAFRKQGFYTTFWRVISCTQQDFSIVYVAGGTAPLSWDFDNLTNKPELSC
jgi:hypothetical protein